VWYDGRGTAAEPESRPLEDRVAAKVLSVRNRRLKVSRRPVRSPGSSRRSLSSRSPRDTTRCSRERLPCSLHRQRPHQPQSLKLGNTEFDGIAREGVLPRQRCENRFDIEISPGPFIRDQRRQNLERNPLRFGSASRLRQRGLDRGLLLRVQPEPLAHRAGCREREQGSADEEVSPPARALQHHRTLMDERSLVSVGFDRVEMRQHGAEVVRREQSMEESGYVTGTSTTSAPPWIRETTRSV